LTHLHLDANNITDEGALLIAQSPYLRQLQQLTISANWLTELGKEALTHAPHLAQTSIEFGHQSNEW
jgi:hypothetical protein